MTTRELTIAAAVAAALGMGGAATAQTTQGGAANNVPGIQGQQVNPSAMPPGTRAGNAPGMNNDRAANNVPGANAQQVNPAAMPPGSRAGDALGMGATAQPGQTANTTAPSGTGAAAGAPAGTSATGAAVAPQNQNLSTTGTPSGYPVGSPQAMGPGQATSAQTMTGTGPTTAQGATNPDRGIPGGQGAQAPSAQPDVNRGTAQVQQDRGMAPGGAVTGSTGGATGATTPGQATTGGGTSSSTTPPAATTQHTQPRTAAAPVPGANSFTEGQARARMGDAGFNDVQDLRLDDQGIWRGRAIRNGQQSGVALDFQGNVVATQ